MDVVKDVGACGLCLVNHRVQTSYSVPGPCQRLHGRAMEASQFTFRPGKLNKSHVPTKAR
jgi:hypothetical protein